MREGVFLEQLLAIVSMLPQAPRTSLPRSSVDMAAMLARLLGKSLIRVLEGELPIALMQAKRLGWEQQLSLYHSHRVNRRETQYSCCSRLTGPYGEETNH